MVKILKKLANTKWISGGIDGQSITRLHAHDFKARKEMDVSPGTQ